MAEMIDLTISTGKACGTCKHYRNTKNGKFFGTKVREELALRFTGVTNNEGVTGGYCLLKSTIRPTSKLGVCNAWELTNNQSKLGIIKRKTCQHIFKTGIIQKDFKEKNLESISPNGDWMPRIFFPYISFRVRPICKMCHTQGPYLDENSNRLDHLFKIFLSKRVHERVMIKRQNIDYLMSNNLKMKEEDKNPDYYYVADWYDRLKINEPLPEGFEIKSSWLCN